MECADQEGLRRHPAVSLRTGRRSGSLQVWATDVLRALLARDRGCLGRRSVFSGVMLLVWFTPRLECLVRTYADVRTLVLLFLLNFLVMRDVSCVRHGGSIK
jgi:hypothetical protein